MAIKAVSKERIEEALLEFDSHHRSKREWQSWETNHAHRYAIEAEGRLYPPKKIISIATGIAVAEFSGGHPTNSYLQKRGFTLVPLEHPESEQVLQFTPGAVYDRRAEIHGPFGGSQQSGISTSASYPAIFLFTGESGEQYGYSDRWEGGAYLYTGEGQRGPMTLTRGNRAIAEHAEKGRALHLFASLGKGNGYVYKGEFTCADVLTRIQPDALGEDRDALVFRLVPVSVSSESVDAEVGVGDEAELANSLAAARLAALEACKASKGDLGQSAPRKIYHRSRKVAHYVLMRADGVCESCEKPAPFKKIDGTHYLEPHHVNRLSDGGLDHPRYVAALCPNCHREIHSGVGGALSNARLKRRLEIIEFE